MSKHDAHEINRLIGEFMDLQAAWDGNQAVFDWRELEALAQKGAQAYNEGAGPSFHALALDGVPHSEFHERFLGYLLHAGFDPFKLASAGSGTAALPVIDHASLAEAAAANPSSARMRASLMELARARLEPLAQEIASGAQASGSPLFRMAEACAESVPDDMLQRIAPALVKPGKAAGSREKPGSPEGYLTPAEAQIENSRRPYG